MYLSSLEEFSCDYMFFFKKILRTESSFALSFTKESN